MIQALEFPVFRRELRNLLRTRKAFWLLVAVIAGSMLVPLAQWPLSVSNVRG